MVTIETKTNMADGVSYLRDLDLTEDSIKINERSLNPESLPSSFHSSLSSLNADDDGVVTDERLESLLLERIQTGHKPSIFQLGQFYFEREMYEKAFVEFDKIKETDFQAKYQLGVMYYDGLGVRENSVNLESAFILIQMYFLYCISVYSSSL